jgi:hypothetical protein
MFILYPGWAHRRWVLSLTPTAMQVLRGLGPTRVCMSCCADGRLASLVAAAGETVLGWFVRRDKVSLVPSMRDRAVCAELPAALAELQPTSAEPR